MKEVDKTIDAICDWIQTKLDREDIIYSSEIAAMTNALAELVSARAKHN